jgi:transcriptional regulator with XRE-family HTH domain
METQMIQTIGKRIAEYRQRLGWTQQYLAERLAISRVAVSHIEMDISIPGERTITLLAGLFKTNPNALVENTTYPQAKSDRLPMITCTYTPLEMDLAIMDNDLEWLKILKGSHQYHNFQEKIYQKWAIRLEDWGFKTIDPHEKTLIEEASQKIILRNAVEL